ncbi:hypothetical protein [Gloeothece verrucosa]|uniref:Uncharacterized protein n=1 Tax=Gloeothece verrucosa (strain PCC 7822) TaxID=497965 RepID=E0ULG8_GLOV7|nr:hypothetical protein [Gloeothece verrucosa]ADN17798.1 conserved hypothetical protein [Gloeothece verrucosa PCC 7822]
MKILFYLLLFYTLLSSNLANANTIKCSSNAISQAGKLLNFHVGGDNRIQIDPKVKELPSLKNPANQQQTFQVLEVWGYIYKAQYRMRLIYYNSPNTSCLLMGQEILENSSP